MSGERKALRGYRVWCALGGLAILLGGYHLLAQQPAKTPPTPQAPSAKAPAKSASPLPRPQPGPARETVDLLVLGGTYVTMDPSRRVIEDGAMAVRGDRIVSIGPRSELEAKYAGRQLLGARDRIVLPGLINTHNHAPMVLFRGIKDDVVLQEWLEKYIWPAEARNLNAEFVEAGTRLAALEMIRGGTTTYADMYFYEDTIARVTKEAGLRGVLGETVLDFPVSEYKTTAEALEITAAFLERWKGDPLIRAAVAPHAIYTASEKTLRDSFALARKHKAPVLIHLSETKREVEESRQKHGVTPPVYLDRLGLLGPEVLAAHCVWVDAADIALLVKREVGCAHNPSSNMMLASGAAPISEMLAANLRLGLGTDGAASNNDLNLFEEMDLAAKLHKLTRGKPDAVTAQQMLELATINGARALHMEKEIGSLEAGKMADFILLRTRAPHAVPAYSVYSQIVYAMKASDVETVVVCGKMLMRAGQVLTLNETAVLARSQEMAARVKQSQAAK
jgi:5-methylthioadenosine/S-adenosylhomocysteine deaminase